MKKTSFGDINSKRSCRSSQDQSTSAFSAELYLDYCDVEWFALDVYGFPLNHSNVLKELIFLPSYHMAKPIEYCKVKYNKIKKKSYDSLKTWRAHFNPQTPIFSELKSTML